MGGQTRPFNYSKLHEGQRRIWEDTHHPTINSVGLLVQTRSIFPWLVRVVSDRSVRYNGKHPKFHRRSFLNMQIYGTQNKCLQILFSNNPNNFFFVIPNVCLSNVYSISWTLKLELIPVGGDLRLSAGSFSRTPAVNRASSKNRSKESSERSLKHSFSVNLRFNFWGLEYLIWRPKMKTWGPAGPKIFVLKVEYWNQYFVVYRFVSVWKRKVWLNRHDFLVLYFCVANLERS